MKLALIPQPQKIVSGKGFYRLPDRGVIGIQDYTLFSVTRSLRQLMKTTDINIGAPRLKNAILITLARQPKAGGYSLRIDSQAGILLEADSVTAAFWGSQTLLQIAEQCPDGRLPCLTIEDWPDFQDRVLYYDVCRGRVPKLERLMELADNLAKYKINQLQLYIEHTFAFRGHPAIGRGASPLTAEDILKLDAYCRERYIELVPSLASFGHMGKVLIHPQYRHLAEDWAKGKYVTRDKKMQQRLKDSYQRYHEFTLSPANPETYRFLDSLFAEFLPLFSSKRFNACCDETVDLGYGQSYKLCQQIGRGRLYLNHILKLNALSQKYGKQMMFWGDIIRHYPKLIPEIPQDVIVLDWGYGADHNFEAIRDFKKAGLSFYACPSVASWALFPLLPQATANIAGFAAAGFKYGAQGLLNTDWGDGGHYNFMEYSWHGYLFGAEQGWNTKADRKSFTERFTRLFLKSDAPSLASAIDRLGEISNMNQCIWRNIYFPSIYFPSIKKPVVPMEARLNARLGRDILKELAGIRTMFQQHAVRRGEDPLRVLPYWIFAVDAIRHAARKLAVYGPGGKITARAQSDLVKEFAELKTRFCKLWMARNRPSEIHIVLDAYRRASRGIIRFEQPTKGCTDFVSKVLVSRPVTGAGTLRLLEYPANKRSLGFAVRQFTGRFCDLHNDVFACGKKDIAVFFACFLEVSEPMSLSAGIGYDGPLKVWIDGKMIFHDPAGTNPATPPDKVLVPFKVNPGCHEALIALSSNHGKAWGLFLRFLRHDVSPRQLQQGPEAYSLPLISTARCRK